LMMNSDNMYKIKSNEWLYYIYNNDNIGIKVASLIKYFLFF
jgi:hypothetical protein